MEIQIFQAECTLSRGSEIEFRHCENANTRLNTKTNILDILNLGAPIFHRRLFYVFHIGSIDILSKYNWFQLT